MTLRITGPRWAHDADELLRGNVRLGHIQRGSRLCSCRHARRPVEPRSFAAMPSVATASNSCRSANKALRIAPRSWSLRGATTAASRITVARRAAETVRSPRALIESATTRRFPGGTRRFRNFFFTSPSTNREVAGRDSPSQSDTVEREVPGWLWMKARVRNCGTDRSLPRWRRICARINRIAAGTASRISAAQSVGEQAPTVAVCNLCILPSSDKSAGTSSRAPPAPRSSPRRRGGIVERFPASVDFSIIVVLSYDL
jgi:hypothetical protein